MGQVEALAACLREEQAARFQAEKRLRDEEQHSAALADRLAGLLKQVEEMRSCHEACSRDQEGLARLPSGHDASARSRSPQPPSVVAEGRPLPTGASEASAGYGCHSSVFIDGID